MRLKTAAGYALLTVILALIIWYPDALPVWAWLTIAGVFAVASQPDTSGTNATDNPGSK